MGDLQNRIVSATLAEMAAARLGDALSKAMFAMAEAGLTIEQIREVVTQSVSWCLDDFDHTSSTAPKDFHRAFCDRDAHHPDCLVGKRAITGDSC